MEAMQLNAKECHTKAGSMTVDIELVEVDRRERTETSLVRTFHKIWLPWVTCNESFTR
jgi:hypothetical protein